MVVVDDEDDGADPTHNDLETDPHERLHLCNNLQKMTTDTGTVAAALIVW